MCTALACNFKGFYFGRTLDLDCSYGEKVVISPRNFPFSFKEEGVISSHYAIIGMGTVIDGFPLYYDAANEKGLCMAGLRFSNNAYYFDVLQNTINIAPFEFIPYILSTCKSVDDAKSVISNLNIADIPFSDKLPNTPLHWIISDKYSSITVESVKSRLIVYDNKVGVLTNNPPFPLQMHRLNNFSNLSAREKGVSKLGELELEQYSLGLGGLGLPGDFSSESRFVRASFLKENSFSPNDEKESVWQFFHIMQSLKIPKGCVVLESGKYHYTLYTSCIDTTRLAYYYTTYENLSLQKVCLKDEYINDFKLLCF